MSKDLELVKRDGQKEGAEELNEIFEKVLPWAIQADNTRDLICNNTMQNRNEIERFINSLYLFKLTEISVSENFSDELSAQIYKRHQALITAAYQSNLTISTIIVGDGGGVVNIYFGVGGDENAKEVFKHQATGIYPGKGIDYVSEQVSSRLLIKKIDTKSHGGILTGIPTQKLDNEKQTLDLTTVIRSMNGQEFVLMITSRPVPKQEAARQIIDLMSLKDRCHALANRNIENNVNLSEQQSKGTSSGKSETESSTGLGKTINGNLSPSLNGSIAGTGSLNLSGTCAVTTGVTWPVAGYVTLSGTIGGTLGGTITAGGSVSKNSPSSTITKSSSVSETVGWSKSAGSSISYEQQNSLAMELELIADKLIKRLRVGLNNGVWENFISYATTNQQSSNILSGTFAGELIKADPDAIPLRSLSCELNEQLPFLVPSKAGSILSGNPLVSYVSSDEASLLLAPPLNSVPGFDIRIKPQLSLTDVSRKESGVAIAQISEHGHAIEGSSFTIDKTDILKHIFVAGITGSGKTTTVKEILATSDTPFLVIESAKREYRRLLANKKFSKMKVFTVGSSEVAPIRHNPFMILPGVSLNSHIDNLKSIFNASFSLYGPMPYILEKCLYGIYKAKGWNITTGKHNLTKITNFHDCRANPFIYPTIVDLKNQVNYYVKHEMDYKGELQDNIRSAIVARLESLAVGSKGFIFNTNDFMNLEELLSQQVVFELENLPDDDDKAFFVGLMLSLICEYRQSLSRRTGLESDDNLKHILVIEEAHRLLENVQTGRTSEMMGNPKGKAVSTFCNIIAEMRSLGQGIIVAEQIPTKIAPDVIKNTNTKIIHRIVSYEEQKEIGTSLGLTSDEARYLNQLSAGAAIAHKEGMAKPIEIMVHSTLTNQPIGDLKIEKLARESYLGNLDEELLLHESELMWKECVSNSALRIIFSLFLAEHELSQVLPLAVNDIRASGVSDYVSDETIILAIKKWFTRILASKTTGIATENKIDKLCNELIDRLWNLESGLTRVRFIAELDKWCNANSVDKLKRYLENMIINGGPENSQELDSLVRSAIYGETDHVMAELKNSLITRMEA